VEGSPPGYSRSFFKEAERKRKKEQGVPTFLQGARSELYSMFPAQVEALKAKVRALASRSAIGRMVLTKLEPEVAVTVPRPNVSVDELRGVTVRELMQLTVPEGNPIAETEVLNGRLQEISVDELLNNRPIGIGDN
jgi:hypothetical protein